MRGGLWEGRAGHVRPGGRELIDELRGDSGVEVLRGAQPELPVVAWSGVHTLHREGVREGPLGRDMGFGAG